MSVLNRVDLDNKGAFFRLKQQIGHVVECAGKDKDVIEQVKACLNEIFPNTKCVHFKVTCNTDKQFFGIRVYPVMDGPKVLEFMDRDYAHDQNAPYFPKYNVELDSKLIDATITILDDEIEALMLYFIYHVVFGGDVRAIIQDQITCRAEDCCSMMAIKSTRTAQELMSYGIRDAVMKSANPFYLLDGSLILKDSFLAAAELEQEANSGLRSVVRAVPFLQSYADDRFIVLSWCLRIVKDYEHLRGPAYKSLMKASELTGSKLESEMMTSTAKLIYTVNNINEAYTDPRYNMVDEKPRTEPMELKPYKDEAFFACAALKSPNVDAETVMQCWAKANEAIANIHTYLNETDGYENHPKWPVQGVVGIYNRQAFEEVLKDFYTIRDRCKELKEKYMDRNDGKIPELFVNV